VVSHSGSKRYMRCRPESRWGYGEGVEGHCGSYCWPTILTRLQSPRHVTGERVPGGRRGGGGIVRGNAPVGLKTGTHAGKTMIHVAGRRVPGGGKGGGGPVIGLQKFLGGCGAVLLEPLLHHPGGVGVDYGHGLHSHLQAGGCCWLWWYHRTDVPLSAGTPQNCCIGRLWLSVPHKNPSRVASRQGPASRQGAASVKGPSMCISPSCQACHVCLRTLSHNG
jgi:hypothetical protein